MEGGLDSIDSKSASEHASKPITASTLDDVTATLGLRVPASVYSYYRRALSHAEQELVREILKQTFVNLVLNKQQITSALEKLNVSISVNVVPQQHAQAQTEDTGTGILKLKRELERLQRELEKALEENLELKSELGRLSRQKDELMRQLHSIKHYDSIGGNLALNSAVLDLHVVAECLETPECNKQKLLDFVKREYEKLSKYARPPSQEYISSIVRMLSSESTE